MENIEFVEQHDDVKSTLIQYITENNLAKEYEYFIFTENVCSLLSYILILNDIYFLIYIFSLNYLKY